MTPPEALRALPLEEKTEALAAAVDMVQERLGRELAAFAAPGAAERIHHLAAALNNGSQGLSVLVRLIQERRPKEPAPATPGKVGTVRLTMRGRDGSTVYVSTFPLERAGVLDFPLTPAGMPVMLTSLRVETFPADPTVEPAEGMLERYMRHVLSCSGSTHAMYGSRPAFFTELEWTALGDVAARVTGTERDATEG